MYAILRFNIILQISSVRDEEVLKDITKLKEISQDSLEKYVTRVAIYYINIEGKVTGLYTESQVSA